MPRGKQSKKTHQRHRRRMLRWRKAAYRVCQVCHWCASIIPPHEVSVEHLTPLSVGGDSVPDNLRLVHKNCNR